MEVLVYLGLGMVLGLIGRAILPGPQALGPTAAMLGGMVGGFLGGVLGDRHLGGASFDLAPTGLILCAVGALVAVAALAVLSARRPAV